MWMFPSLLNQLQQQKSSRTVVNDPEFRYHGEIDFRGHRHSRLHKFFVPVIGITDVTHVLSIMRNTTTTRATREDTLSVMVTRLEVQVQRMSRVRWYQILSTLTPSKTLLNETFGDMIDELHKTTIQPKHFYVILSDSGSS